MRVTEFILRRTTYMVKGVCLSLGQNILCVDGVQLDNLDESLTLRKHSMDGPNWGYGGSGPSQAALMVCLHIFQNKHLALELYRPFKKAFVVHWGVNGKSFEEQIDLTDFLIDNREAFQEAAVQESYEEEQAGWDLLEQAEQLLDPIVESSICRPQENALRSQFTVGDVVEMQITCLNTPAGSRAVVYESYEQGGISVISEKGEVLGGFCLEDQQKCMRFLYKAESFTYSFRSVSYLIDDWRNGVFLGVFTNEKSG